MGKVQLKIKNQTMMKQLRGYSRYNISIAGYTFNLLYDSGCGDLVCKKAAIDKLMRIGRAKQEIPEPIVLSGVGDNKVVCKTIVLSGLGTIR